MPYDFGWLSVPSSSRSASGLSRWRPRPSPVTGSCPVSQTRRPPAVSWSVVMTPLSTRTERRSNRMLRHTPRALRRPSGGAYGRRTCPRARTKSLAGPRAIQHPTSIAPDLRAWRQGRRGFLWLSRHFSSLQEIVAKRIQTASSTVGACVHRLSRSLVSLRGAHLERPSLPRPSGSEGIKSAVGWKPSEFDPAPDDAPRALRPQR